MDRRSNFDEEKSQIQQSDPQSDSSTVGGKEDHNGQQGVAVLSKKLKNPLSGMTKDELMVDVEAFAKDKALEDIVDLLKKGALIAQDPKNFEKITELDEAEKEWLRMEKTRKWKQPKMMYFMTSKFDSLRLNNCIR